MKNLRLAAKAAAVTSVAALALTACGGSNFNEVYFTDVRIPDSQRLGAVDDGWKVALVTLMNERLAVGGGGGVGCCWRWGFRWGGGGKKRELK